jgi:nicotinamide-nucleotide amidase
MKKSSLGVFLLSIGDELLDGRTANTNATYFGEQLRLAGIPVAEIRCVSDRVEDIGAALRHGKKFPLVITTGGLGPTNDDRTLEAAAKTFRTPLVPTKASLEHVRKRYEARGMELTPARLRMAAIPRGAKVVENLTGTAPGVKLKIENTTFVFLPGPPNECRPMFAAALADAGKLVAGKKLAHRMFWRTFGRGESDIYQRVAAPVAALEKKYPRTFAFGVHISFPCIDLTVESWDIKGEPRPNEKELSTLSEQIELALGSLCVSREREDLVSVVARLLSKKNLTLSVAESCTGGLLGKMLTDQAGSSAYFWGGVISYDNRLKTGLLGVKPDTIQSHGAVSEHCAREMAEGIRQKTGTDFSLSITGVAGPGGGNAEKPVGTVYVALSNKQGSKIAHHVILGGKGSRDQNRAIAAHLALDLLRDALRE